MPITLVPMKCQRCGDYRKVLFILKNKEYCGECYYWITHL